MNATGYPLLNSWDCGQKCIHYFYQTGNPKALPRASNPRSPNAMSNMSFTKNVFWAVQHHCNLLPNWQQKPPAVNQHITKSALSPMTTNSGFCQIARTPWRTGTTKSQKSALQNKLDWLWIYRVLQLFYERDLTYVWLQLYRVSKSTRAIFVILHFVRD